VKKIEILVRCAGENEVLEDVNPSLVDEKVMLYPKGGRVLPFTLGEYIRNFLEEFPDRQLIVRLK
jgi:hypothetical protein